MGEVYRADDLRLGQPLALKFLPEEVRESPHARDRLVQEVRVGRNVAHPNVCRIYDIVEVGSQLFIAMEFVDGENLGSLLARVGRFTGDRALGVARDICAGLAAIHDQGIVHRDLKPANVMIDGRGRARITDFGLAVSGEAARLQEFAGTPAYMAPEQLAGTGANVSSDLYALGLVLFELFSGRRAIREGSIDEISRQHEQLPEVSLSSLAPGVDPAIESVIRRCLQSEPDQRPASAEEVGGALPDRDPIEAALAAGMTPSPSDVAEAGSSGELTRRTAWALLGMTVFLIACVAALSQRTMVFNRMEMALEPEILRHQAREIAAVVPHISPVVGHAEFFHSERERIYSSVPLTEPPHSLLFVYRESPRSLRSRNFVARVTWEEPAHTVSGMRGVILDGAGRLIELIAVPPQISEIGASGTEWQWDELLAKTGADAASLRPAEPGWAAPVDSDRKWAWEGRYPNGGPEIRIEAASYRGQPVWLSVIFPWTEPERMREEPRGAMSTLTLSVNVAVGVLLVVLAAGLVFRQLRRGRSDLRGAAVLAVVVYLTASSSLILQADHVPNVFREVFIVYDIFARSLLAATFAWLFYVAAEPLVRRRWPEILISWSRLIAGRWRDPMVGRDLLMGAAGGALAMVVWHTGRLAPAWFSLPAPAALGTALPFGGNSQTGSILLMAVAEAFFRSIAVAFLLGLLRGLLRNRAAAAVTAILLTAATVIYLSPGLMPFRLLFPLVGATIGVLLIVRFGLIASIAYAYTILIYIQLPTTFNPDAWYFGRALLTLLLPLVIAAIGSIISLGRNSIFPEALFEE